MYHTQTRTINSGILYKFSGFLGYILSVLYGWYFSSYMEDKVHDYLVGLLAVGICRMVEKEVQLFLLPQ